MSTRRISVLFTHTAMDATVYQLAQRLAGLPTFAIYITTAEGAAPELSGAITYLPIPDISSKVCLRSIVRLRQYCRQLRFDIIYSVSSSSLSNALLASLGTPCINIGYRGTGAKVRRLDPTYYLGILNPRIRHIVCENVYIERYLGRYISPRMLSTATKPFDLAWVQEAKAHPIVPRGAEQGLRLISVGNTKGRPHKGLRTLIQAVNALGDASLQIILVGDYEEEDYRLAMEGEVKGCYHFVGVSPQAMHYIAGADIFVLPSSRDASPRVVREAMALGLPTIVSNIEGSRDLIEEGVTGLLFEAGNPHDLAEKILHLKQDAGLRQRMGQRGVQRIREVFGFECYTQYFADLFVRLSARE